MAAEAKVVISTMSWNIHGKGVKIESTLYKKVFLVHPKILCTDSKCGYLKLFSTIIMVISFGICYSFGISNIIHNVANSSAL